MITLPDTTRNCQASAEGADSSLTLPQNSQENVIEACGGRVWGSEDYTVLNNYLEVQGSDDDHEAFIASLDEAKARAEESKTQKAPFFHADKAWLIRSRGIRAGGKNGIMFDYVLEGGGFLFLLSKHRYPCGYNFNGRVLASSEVLMEYNGLERAHEVIRDGWRSLGCTVLEERPSRLDYAVDIPVDLDELVSLVESGAFIHKFKSVTIHKKAGNKFEGITFGRGDLVLRIYDKRSELWDKRAVKKQAIMAQNRFAWSEDGPILRVEWQIRGQVMKKWDISNVSAWFQKRAAIFEYLNTVHTRCADEPVKDRTHSARVKAGAIWTEVITAFRLSVCGGEEVAPLRPQPRFGATVRGLIKQAVGCLVTAAAIEEAAGGIPEKRYTERDFWRVVRRVLITETMTEDLVQRWVGRMAEIAITAPTSPIWFQSQGRRPIELPT